MCGFADEQTMNELRVGHALKHAGQQQSTRQTEDSTVVRYSRQGSPQP